jgi:transcriptional regulator with XRE-family HTH domain
LNPLSKRLKQARKKMEMSQMALGVAAGIDEFSAGPRINQYESGKRNPDYLTLERIGKILGCPVPFFYAKDDIFAEIITLLGKLNKEKKKQALELISSI